MLTLNERRLRKKAHAYKTLLLLGLFVGLSFVVHRSLLETGVIVAGDFTRTESFARFVSSTVFPLWDEYGQSSNLITSSQAGIYAPAILLSSIYDLPSTTVYFAYYMIFSTIGGFYSYKFSEYILQRNYKRPRIEFPLISAIFFMFATFVLETAFHPTIAFSLYLSPMLMYFVIRGVDEGKTKYLLLTSLVYASLAMALHFVIFGLVIVIGYIFYDMVCRLATEKGESRKAITTALRHTAVILVPSFLLGAYWILPIVMSGGQENYSNILTREDPQLLYRFVSVTNTLSVKGFFNLDSVYPTNDPQFMYTNMLAITLTLVAIGSAYFLRQYKHLPYLFIVFSGAIVVTLVPKYFPDFYNYLIFDVPGASLYSWVLRAPKVYHLMSLCMVPMLAIVGQGIYGQMKESRIHFRKLFPSMFFIIILALAIVPNASLIDGDIGGLHDPVRLPDDYAMLVSYLEGEDKEFKSVWGPPYAGLSTTWTSSPVGPLEEQISPIQSYDDTRTFDYYLHPILFGIRYPYGSMTYHDKTTPVSEFLSPLAIKYVILHNDVSRMYRQTNEISDALESQNLTSIRIGNYTVYEIVNASNQITALRGVVMIQGGLAKLKSAFDEEMVDQTEMGIIFSDLDTNNGTSIWKHADTIVGNNDLLFADFLTSQSKTILLSPFENTENFMPSKHWSRTSVNKPPFLNNMERFVIDSKYQYDFGKGIAFTYGKNSSMTIPFSIEAPGNYHIFVRSLASHKGGEIVVQFENSDKIINTLSSHGSLHWTDVGSEYFSEGEHAVSLLNQRGLNAVNLIILVSEQDYRIYERDFGSVVQSMNFIYMLEAGEDFKLESAGPIPSTEDREVTLAKGEPIFTEFRAMNHGDYSFTPKGTGDFILSIDDSDKHILKADETLTLYVESGLHKVSIAAADSEFERSFDSLIIQNMFDDWSIPPSDTTDRILKYERLDASHHKVSVHSTTPLVIAFAQAYDKNWVAEVRTSNGYETREPIPLYGVINAFAFDEIGTYDVYITYKPQDWFWLGSAVSVSTLIAVVSYLIICDTWKGRTSRREIQTEEFKAKKAPDL